MKNYIQNFNLAMKWIDNNTIGGNGITVTSKEKRIYPEVTGYYIPTLLTWGERERACNYAKYLCSIQKEDGSWYDSEDKSPYVFDSAQILKGLIAIREIMPEVDEYIIKGCDWILSNMQPDGRLITPNKDAWGSNEDFCSELIHIYCLSPIKEAGIVFDKTNYLESVDKILGYYKTNKLDRIKNFSLLSHFYAYVMEGLYDLGEVELCREAMLNLEKYRNWRGGIPGLRNVPWVCSTGLFQLAIVWYKLGEIEKGNSLFYYALQLQNETGGWYGSYPAPYPFASLYRGKLKPYYFPDAEISWAVKYFLDALALKEKSEFERMAPIFYDEIDENDGRYLLIKQIIEEKGSSDELSICDVGCGKGRYLKRLIMDYPRHKYYAYDLSEQVMKDVAGVADKKTGYLTQISYSDEAFDVVYVCEAYEHAINLKGAFKELYRILKPGGTLIIIDKPLEKQGQLKLYEWEQWISDEDIKNYSSELGGTLKIIESVPYEGKDDGLFRAWIINRM